MKIFHVCSLYVGAGDVELDMSDILEVCRMSHSLIEHNSSWKRLQWGGEGPYYQGSGDAQSACLGLHLGSGNVSGWKSEKDKIMHKYMNCYLFEFIHLIKHYC